MELQQGIRHRRDKTHPFRPVSAVLFSRQCQQLSTRLHWLISCPCELCCSNRWTRVWRFPMPRPGQLHSQLFLFSEMTHHPGGPTLCLGLQTDDPGRRPDGPRLLWEEPGGWTTRESLLDPVLQSQGLHQLIHLPEMLLLWISLRFWILRPRSRRDPFRRRRWRRRSQEDLGSTVSAVQTSCYDFQGIIQSQPCQDAQAVQGIAGSGRQWSYRSGIVVGPAFSQRHDGFYCPYRPRVKGRWRGQEDNVIWDFEYSFFDVQAPHGEADLPERTIQTQGPSWCSVRAETSRWQRLQRFQGAFIVPDVPSDVLRHWGVGQEVSDLRFSRWLHGGVCNWRTFSQGRPDETSEGEVGHTSGSPSLSGVSRLCGRV